MQTLSSFAVSTSWGRAPNLGSDKTVIIPDGGLAARWPIWSMSTATEAEAEHPNAKVVTYINSPLRRLRQRPIFAALPPMR